MTLTIDRAYGNICSMKFVYLAQNNVNGKIYIGQTNNFRKRKRDHISKARRAGGIRYPFHNGLLKHNFNFSWEVLYSGDDSNEDIDMIEEFFIWYYRSMSPHGYNIKNGGNTRKFTEEMKIKMSILRKEKNKDVVFAEKMRIVLSRPDRRAAISDSLRTRISTDPEYRAVLLDNQKKTNTPEINEIRRKRLNALWADREYREKTAKIAAMSGAMTSKKILCHQTGIVYPSQIEASRQLHVDKKDIWNILHGKMRHAKGYTFERVE